MPRIKYRTCLLWADDLILLSDSVSGLQKQLNGLFRFCSDNMMIVNEMKTKVMVYGPDNRNVVFKFNGKTLDIVDQYKYLGNITKSIKNMEWGYVWRKLSISL